MSLAVGLRLGTCEVLGSLRAGGTGEVCRARETGLAECSTDFTSESFGVSPDGKSITLAVVERSFRLMLAEGVDGI